MSCSLPGVGSLLLSQNKTPTDSLATGPWAPSHPDSGVQCLSLSLTLSLADLSKHRPLGISLEPNSDGEGKHWCKGVLIFCYLYILAKQTDLDEFISFLLVCLPGDQKYLYQEHDQEQTNY